MLTNGQILDTLRQALEHLSAEYGVKRIGVFGSCAKGQLTDNSDVDIIGVHSPIGARCPRIGGMEAKQLKAELMKEMEAEIDQLVESYKHSGPLTMTQLEDLLLAARQRIKLAERLIALQEQEVAAPIKQETGKVLRSKGKKSHSHEPVRQSDI
jgi:predicted nucleotidyltransferase